MWRRKKIPGMVACKSHGGRAPPRPPPPPSRQHNEPQSDVIEVLGHDGLFEKGRIVDCAADGLMIDWECEKKPTSHFIPFGKIFLTRREHFYSSYEDRMEMAAESDIWEDYPVEVLIRPVPQEPKKWCPGEVLAGAFAPYTGFAVVRAIIANGAKIVVVSGYRIRERPTEAVLQALRVGKEHFFKRRWYLPKEYFCGEARAQEMLDALNRKSGGTMERTRTMIRAVNMDAKSLTSICIGYKILSKSKQNHTGVKLRALLWEASRDCTSLREQQHKRTFSEADLESPESDEAESNVTCSRADHAILLLPVNLIVSVFEYLDSAEQIRLRRVCSAWDSMRKSLTLTRVLRVHYKNKRQDCLSVASLHHAWTTQTKIILNAGVCTAGNTLFCGGRLLRNFLQNGLHTPVEQLMLVDIVVGRDECTFQGFIAFLFEELQWLATACQTVSFRDIRFRWADGTSQPGGAEGALLHILQGQISGAQCVSVKNLWARVNNSLMELDAVQLHYLSDWIKGPGSSYFRQIKTVHILNDRQSPDPADDNPYRNRKWGTSDLDHLDLPKLSKLTLQTLFAVGERNSNLDIAISW